MSFSKKPVKINPQEVDPSVYYYDEVYDEKSKDDCVTDSQSNGGPGKGSKYLEGMKQAAEKRKVEKEIRKFKRYARDREDAERDGSLADKDVYISSSYRARMEEIKLLEKGRIELSSKKQEKNDDNDSVYKSNAKSRYSRLQTKTSVQDLHKARSKVLEDRRKHLRVLLAKKTTGKIFEDAVKRYKSRHR